MYQTLVRDWRNENLTLRQFASPIAARNLGNDIPDEAVDALLDVCKQNAPVFQRFFQLKARLLGVTRLRRYDIYAPVVKSDKTYEFDQAAEMVLESFSAFHPDFGRQARRVFDESHMDSEVRKGKQSGAFCASVTPDMTPWVKLNYQGHADDVATMAHELGHAIHSMLAEKHTVFTFHSSLPLAETASTFGEMMLVDRLLAERERRGRPPRHALPPDGRRLRHHHAPGLLCPVRKAGPRDGAQNNASVDDLARPPTSENLKEQFGDSVEIGEEFKWEWVSIPHIYHTPFYVYAYTFGQLLVLSLYQQFKADGRGLQAALHPAALRRAARTRPSASAPRPASTSAHASSGRAVSMSSPAWSISWTAWR